MAAQSDASKVACSGEGLAGGVVGSEIRAFIDTRKGKEEQSGLSVKNCRRPSSIGGEGVFCQGSKVTG